MGANITANIINNIWDKIHLLKLLKYIFQLGSYKVLTYTYIIIMYIIQRYGF